MTITNAFAFLKNIPYFQYLTLLQKYQFVPLFCWLQQAYIVVMKKRPDSTFPFLYYSLHERAQIQIILYCYEIKEVMISVTLTVLHPEKRKTLSPTFTCFQLHSSSHGETCLTATSVFSKELIDYKFHRDHWVDLRPIP